MEVRRVFVDELKMEDGLALIQGHLHKYVVKVLRKGPGDRIDLLDGKWRLHHCTVRSINSKDVYLNVLDSESAPEGTHPKVTLCVSPIKGARMDWLVEKATELGVDRIIPVVFARTVVRPDDAKAGKYERFRRIAIEASRQSGRFSVPEVTGPVPLHKILPYVPDRGNRWVFYEKERERTMKDLMAARIEGEIFAVTGPEGGIEDQEMDWLTENGFTPSSLGESILRAETAPLVVLSIILYERPAG
jgi:16S rRNA (uracil1498-N3)-methyltransferase